MKTRRMKQLLKVTAHEQCTSMYYGMPFEVQNKRLS